MAAGPQRPEARRERVVLLADLLLRDLDLGRLLRGEVVLELDVRLLRGLLHERVDLVLRRGDGGRVRHRLLHVGRLHVEVRELRLELVHDHRYLAGAGAFMLSIALSMPFTTDAMLPDTWRIVTAVSTLLATASTRLARRSRFSDSFFFRIAFAAAHRRVLMQEYRREALRWLAEEYHDLNGTQYDVLEDFPTPLEFSRMVHISRPILIRGSAIPSLSDAAAWSKRWLADKMGDRDISVAVTPNGYCTSSFRRLSSRLIMVFRRRADAVTRGPDNKLYFAEPLTQKMSAQALLRNEPSNRGGAPDGPAAADASQDARTSQAEVHYLQSQNGNLFSNRYYELRGDSEDPSEFEPLREYIPSEIPWCSDALGTDRNPDAVNLWIGDEKSVTSIHSGASSSHVFRLIASILISLTNIDPYENIYTVLRGSKQFTLLPPTEGWCLKAETPLVRWSSVTDPTDPRALPAEAHPIHITVNAGETLYLPAGWWHYVRQRGFTVAVNYWYDMEGRGMSWVWLNFLRGTEEPPLGNGEDEPEGGQE
ncbi:hypothetical protein ACG7TL_004013 [Trametes sanguinea]